MISHNVLISGDTTLEEIASMVEPMIPADRQESWAGYTYGPGLYSIVDADKAGDYYDDDLGVPLSQYRFEVSTRIDEGHNWAKQVFQLLSERTPWALLWLTDLQRIEAERPALLPAA